MPPGGLDRWVLAEIMLALMSDSGFKLSDGGVKGACFCYDAKERCNGAVSGAGGGARGMEEAVE